MNFALLAHAAKITGFRGLTGPCKPALASFLFRFGISTVFRLK